MSQKQRSQIMIDTENRAHEICLEMQAAMAKDAELEHKRRLQEQVNETMVQQFEAAHAPPPLTPQQKSAKTKARNLTQAEDRERLAREKAFAEQEIIALKAKQTRLREALAPDRRPRTV